MKKRSYALIAMIAALLLASLACQYVQPILNQPTPAGTLDVTAAPVTTATPLSPMPDVSGNQPFKLTGSFTVTNDFVIATYYVEQAVALTDMHGFVIRDREWELPIDSQVLGFMRVNNDYTGGEYTLYLPQRPQGIYNDVDNNERQDTGVQIFAVSYSPNLTGGPFSEGDDRSRGWPGYLASIRTDSENKDEVVGGKLVVWSPDANQQFPTGFGSDGLLFTADDPVAPISAGYAIVNLDDDPFSLSQAPEESLTLYEPTDVAEKDFSTLSYTEAFDKMFEIVRKEYAFNGIAGKQPDWDALYAELKPRVEEAERKRDGLAYYQAVRDFIWAFKDGHVYMSSDLHIGEDFRALYGGGYGFTLRELDNGSAVATYIYEGGPAEQAGLQVGAQIIEIDNVPVKEAIGKVKPYFLQSSDFGIRLEQARFVVRAPVGYEAPITFKNPGGVIETKTFRAVGEFETYYRGGVDYSDDPAPLLPVDSRIIEQAGAQVGYIRINSNYDDLNLIIRLFERALKEFEDRGVAGVIIDMRTNGGGAPLGLAGFLTGQEIALGQLEYYSEKTGRFEPEGEPEKVLPNVNQYDFGKLVTLVGPNCASACEIESYGFSQVPGMIVVGQYPTGGIEAEVGRGQFKLPEEITMQIPTGRFTLPDGSLFLEGQGVIPTLRVPVDESTVLTEEDAVLQYGIDAVLKPAGQGLKPSGPPTFNGNTDDIAAAARAGADDLQALARETYTAAEMEQMDRTFTYTVTLTESKDLLWGWGWCAVGPPTLDDNFKHIELVFNVDGENIPIDKLGEFPYDQGAQSCRAYYGLLTEWPAGQHKLEIAVTFDAPINDGQSDYAAGTQVFQYDVYVKP